MIFLLDEMRPKMLSLQAQSVVRNGWLRERLTQVIPLIMQREGVDMWLIIAREYNEDPVLLTLLPEPAMSARRRTILMFYLNPDGVLERLSIDRYGYEGYYTQAWDPSIEDQYTCLKRLIKERQPEKIAINFSHTFPFGDGLSYTEYETLLNALGEAYYNKLCSGERLCVGWLEHRTQAELTAYPAIIQMGHSLIAEAFSRRVIHPGITTTDDVTWWLRQNMQDFGLRAWFHPTIEIQRAGSEHEHEVIMPGDLLHCDVGFHYLGLATDQQQHAYVLKPREQDAPEGLKAALQIGNRLQDLHMEAMKIGQTGNEILATILKGASVEGINATVYSHPLGYHGHAAGPTIGLWDMQQGVPGKGDYPVYDHTCYSIELNIKAFVPEWNNQQVRIALEEDAVMTNGKMHWLSGRQTVFHLI
jgi:hypothetical protein